MARLFVIDHGEHPVSNGKTNQRGRQHFPDWLPRTMLAKCRIHGKVGDDQQWQHQPNRIFRTKKIGE